MKLLLDCLIHGSGGWGFVSVVYQSGVGPKGPALRGFRIIKKHYQIYLLLENTSWHFEFFSKVDSLFPENVNREKKKKRKKEEMNKGKDLY